MLAGNWPRSPRSCFPRSDRDCGVNTSVVPRTLFPLGFSWSSRGQRPEFVASLDIFVRETLIQDERVVAHQEAIYRRETQAFGSRELLVFQRNG